MSIKDALMTRRDVLLLQGCDEDENLIIGGDFHEHVVSARDGYERWHGEQGYGIRNEEGKMPLEHAEAEDLAVVNTFFEKKNEHLITYRSGGRTTQTDYILVRRKELKNVFDDKLIPSDCIAPQLHLLVMDMRLQHRRPKRPQERMKLWKLAEHKTALETLVRTAIRTAIVGDVNTKCWNAQ